ncbi:hypothetical protein STEG23_037202 [Scotinomys teguina]
MLGVLCCDFYITLDEYVFKFTFLIGRPSVRERKLLHPKAFVDLQLRILHFTSIEPHRRFTKMDTKNPKTLFDLAIQSLLRNESVLLQALEDIPRDLFVPLFTAAFQGGHKNVVIEMVKVWPFHCLHIGPLTAQQSQGELLKATIENFPVCPAENSASWRHKLRILDLRRDNDCRTTCRQLSMKEPSCFHSCAYSDSSIRKIEGQLPIVNSGSMIQICRPVELLVDLFLHGSLLEKDIFNLFIIWRECSGWHLSLCCMALDFAPSSHCPTFLAIHQIASLFIQMDTFTASQTPPITPYYLFVTYQGCNLAHSNVSLIYDVLEYMKEPDLQLQSWNISMTQGEDIQEGPQGTQHP